jgi:integrase/recombinase XerD
MIEKIITKVLALVDYLPAEDLQKVQAAMLHELSPYDLVPKSTDLVPYTGAPQILKLYLASKKVDGLSPKTLINYDRELSIFFARLQKDPLQVTSMDIRMYLALKESEGLQKSTLSTLLSNIKAFYNWLENEEYITKSPCRKIKAIKTPKHVRKPLSHEELEKVRIACEDTREKAMLEFFYSTGCRLDEVLKLNRDDINWQSGSCVVLGKGSKEREVYLNAKALVHLQIYLAERKDSTEALFVSERAPHGRLKARSVEDVFKNLGIRAGLKRPLFPHLIRHTTATNALMSGASLAVIQKMLGHENPATTQIYAQLDRSEVRSEHKKHVA